MFNDGFYPTPRPLIARMVDKISVRPNRILEGQAGKGDIVDYLREKRGAAEIVAIESDKELRAILRGKNIAVIDSCFLGFSGPDKFDLIIGNPPFKNGAKHLLKAISLMYRGQIIYLLNAETLRYPFSNSRKTLVRKLEKLGAEIEYIEGAFKDAERPTGVEVALVNIVIERKIEDDLFIGANEHAGRCYDTIQDNYEVATGRSVQNLVADYDRTVEIATETILSYYRNYKKIGSYIGLNSEIRQRNYSEKDLTDLVQQTVNDTLKKIRTDYWRKLLDLKEVNSRLTRKRRIEFEHCMHERCYLNFTESNILQFGLNLIDSYEDTITESVLEIFDKFTVAHCMELENGNIQFFDGWKTNKAYRCNQKVIIPLYAGSYEGGPFRNSAGTCWDLDFDAGLQLQDIDLVMNYLDGMRSSKTIRESIKAAFIDDENKNIISSYFKITCCKKGTIHLTFLDADILRRFNVIACKGRGWLPVDYGTKKYNLLTQEERDVVNSFEGEKTYSKNLGLPLYSQPPKTMMIAA